MNKEEYIKYAKDTFKGKALELVLNNIELFYDDTEIEIKNKYSIGDEVFLKKGTFMHGIAGLLDNFDWIVENGFIGNDFTIRKQNNKIKNSIGMWNIQNDILLKDYVNLYSGFTITYTIGRGSDATGSVCELIPYHKFDEYTEKINNDERIWMYYGEETKEVRFIPSLVSNKRQIAFILNMESDYAKKLAYADVWNTNLDCDILESFLDNRYYPKFLDLRFNRDAHDTNRESAIIFGLPPKLIEGVFVGRQIENDIESLKHIKSKLPNAYICNLDGKVIM